jgi:3-hydroxyisobutyrate dehydrogenase-like beta-hydroxyacid dehydrogenase
MKIGFIGIGQMGKCIARLVNNLIALAWIEW